MIVLIESIWSVSLCKSAHASSLENLRSRYVTHVTNTMPPVYACLCICMSMCVHVDVYTCVWYIHLCVCSMCVCICVYLYMCLCELFMCLWGMSVWWYGVCVCVCVLYLPKKSLSQAYNSHRAFRTCIALASELIFRMLCYLEGHRLSSRCLSPLQPHLAQSVD